MRASLQICEFTAQQPKVRSRYFIITRHHLCYWKFLDVKQTFYIAINAHEEVVEISETSFIFICLI